MPKKNTFTVLSRKLVYKKGPITLVDCMIKLPDGQNVSRQILEHPGAVVIIPKMKSGKFVLIRQFRFAAQDWLFEFPAGGVEKGEKIKNAASRELMEEIGYKPGKLKKVVEFYPTPGICAEVMYVYLAEDLKPQKAQADEDEDIEIFEVTLSQIGQMIKTGKIKDAKTIISYFYLRYPKSFAPKNKL